MQHIQTVTVGSGGAASITFMAVGDIPSDYTDLVVLISARSEFASGGVPMMQFKLNGTEPSSFRRLFGNGSSATSNTEPFLIPMTSSAMTANTFGNGSLYIPNYRSSVNKSISVDGVMENNATLAWQLIGAALWTGTAAITSIELYGEAGTGDLAEGTSASLYGITAGSDGITAVS